MAAVDLGTPTPEPKGCLVYVMGPSGAGKDTLIDYARARVDPATVIFARRFITRPAGAGGENHIMLSEREFAARRDAGLFALTWKSHGLWYGIGVEVDAWLARGLAVVVSGSRAAWPMAQARYSNLRGLVVDAPTEIRAARLIARGREDERAVSARLEREVALPLGERLQLICNDGPVAAAGEQFVGLLRTIDLQVR
jgi:ribose 1,5-bisphosphokinase